ncbi:MAG: hypothetical protein M1407_04170 [Deltaproteobacteria bacterium]|nr:hypothetical protein [Deltaproteobacteria bacterium]
MGLKLFKRLMFVFILSALIVSSSSLKSYASSYGVFTKVAVNVGGSYSSVINKVKSALNNIGWNVIAVKRISLPKGDSHISTVIAANNNSYDKYMTDNGKNSVAAFGFPLRVSVYTTPTQGTVVSMINLPAIARTFSGNSYIAYAAKTNSNIKSAIRKAVGGTASNTQYGPMRTGRFPGGIGGGSFPGSVVVIQNYSGSKNSNLEGVAALVKKGIQINKSRWHYAYEIDDPSAGFIELGVTRNSTERHSISIDSGIRATKTYKNPGIDHSPAFPVEILVYRDGGYTNIGILGEMWRMKYYFADAGMWAFMTHMGMPGSIQGSLKQLILYGTAY